MNQERRRGFIGGLLTAAVVLGLGGTTLAAGRSILVDDTVSVTLNGAPFTPKDANQKALTLFAYNGTIYAPVRALSDLVGLDVNYNSQTKTAELTTPNTGNTTAMQATQFISADQVKQIVLSDAGAAADAQFTKLELDWDNGVAVYEVEFYANGYEYEYELDATNGVILKRESEMKSFSASQSVQSTASTTDTTPVASFLSAEQAEQIALTNAGVSAESASFLQCDVNWNTGVPIYNVGFCVNHDRYTCELNGQTGAVLNHTCAAYGHCPYNGSCPYGTSCPYYTPPASANTNTNTNTTYPQYQYQHHSGQHHGWCH